ncbi:MAG: GspE/PulE family protein [Parcubacteria group bacterium]|jgi:type II secretory ATPase GspE/PulE/Tfp pilus assembly ATPase PilB-like protein
MANKNGPNPALHGAHEEDVQRVLAKMKHESEEQQAANLAGSLGIPYVDLNIFPIDPETLRTIPKEKALEHQIVCIQKFGKNISVALANPADELAAKYLEQLEKSEGYKIKIYVCSSTGLQKTVERYKHIALSENLEELRLTLSGSDLEEFEKNLKDVIDLQKRINEIPTTEVINIVMAGAVKMEASDIHFEPQAEGIRLRFRLDGVLQNISILPSSVYHYILSRVKVLSGMKINIRDISQDGHFSINLEGNEIDVRVSILPGNYGENIVMRLLNQAVVALKFDDLGLKGLAYDKLREEIKKPNGMVLNTGPTGSGKTTTLYAIINQLNSPEVKIITVEDPIEYKIKDISQTQVSRSRGYTFANALRAIVRQDPDVILVGEIRDDETASIALHASLTGHLVLSTLHTNSAIETIPRLIDMGVKPSLLPAAVNAFIAQRLVRKLCPHCREEYAPARETVESVKKILAVISPKAKLTIPKEINKFYRAGGCSKCHGLGYKGRVGIFEIFTLTEEISKRVTEMAPEAEILSLALEAGMITMLQDGILKALDGVTSLEEVQRVTGEGKFLEELYEKIISQLLLRSIVITVDDGTEIETLKSDLPKLRELVKASPPEKSLRLILAGGLKLAAGDIHIEPEEESVKIRYRIDGILQDAAEIPITEYPQLLGNLKILSGFKASDTEQGVRDSRFGISLEEGAMPEIKEREIDVRISIILGGYGETVVMRLLNQSAQALEIEKLGIRQQTLDKILNKIRKPNGIILNTGPTGSGKSTTLYSILSILNKPGVKIITVEDPIEYRLKGILQTQVDDKKGYTFPKALRALLRQNPDIMMIGEIRDGETAQIAVQAALTGHLVLSTLHTNNAAGSVQRLINMEVSSTDIASSVNAFMAQRLVRLLCPDCKKPVPLDEKTREHFTKILETISDKTGVEIPGLDKITNIYAAQGCEKCNRIGYKGRTTVSEILEVTKEMEELITRGPTTSEVEDLAIKQGMLTMTQDGILKVLEGITSLEEIGRVTEE